MLNTLWSFLLLLGIGCGLINGQASQITAAILEGASSGIQLCITMFGVIALWSGVMEIGERAGLVEMIAGKMKPLLHFLFPRIPDDHPALRYIATNFVANVLGLGWAATPAGLKAMEALVDLENERRQEENASLRTEYSPKEKPKKKSLVSAMPKDIASNEMCTFLILNISSLQLIPVTMIAYRSQYGSTNPAAITGPALIATAVSTAVAIIFCKVMGQRRSCI